MAVEIKVPELGESVVEATVARWLVKAGDVVKAGDAVVALETDKVDLEVPATTDGVLASIVAEEGQDVQIGDVLGTINTAASAGEEAQPAGDRGRRTSDEREAQPATEKSETPAASERVTPVAKRMAQDEGVDLAGVSGSGAGGRVTKEDVVRHLRGREDEPVQPAVQMAQPQMSAFPAAAQAIFARPNAERETRVKLSRRRRTIAARLVEAQQTAAMLTTFNEIDMSAVMDLRQRRRQSFEEQFGVRLGFMSFFTKAVIGALKAFPQINAEIEGDEMILKHYYDIGIAVGAEEGLVVPVLRDADRMSFAEIEAKIRELGKKSQEGALSLNDLQGGSFTITNGGVFGSLLSTPILNPPQVGILGLHKIEERAVVVAGEIVIRPMMYVALSYDHRIVDGREAVQFLVKVKDLIEDPERMLLEG
ncbi:MAG: 2-oxoglutarate dehydrogenase complex dihydrolipoyllysine-residue succinyltransferase [Caldilineaceae bacterium]|nr:2-oxoglutarate dehydrogenase complex dihydrolipoyllysine-residue succinyltransferase [Caldilineaceae bacterium]